MKRKNLIRLLSFFSAAVLALGGCVIKLKSQARDFYTQTGYDYSRCMQELGNALGNINILLEKSMYVTTPAQISGIAAKLFYESEAAKSSLAQLPSYSGENNVISKFLSQVGNYTLHLSQESISGSEITAEHRDNIEKLRQFSDKLATAIDDMQAQYNDEKWIAELENRLSDSAENITFSSGITEIEESLTGYPTLIYDGPFSDHLMSTESEMLKDEPQVTAEQALEIAAQTFGVDTAQLSPDGEEDGKIPLYRFSSELLTVAVSKAGGHIVYFRKTPQEQHTELSYEQAVEKAKAFLKANSDFSFVTSYYFADEGICTINFAYKDGATICYTDLVKVGVSLYTGEVVLVEARGFLMNHKQRTIVTPEYTYEQAQEVLSDALQVVSVAQALIPTAGGEEKLCYEYLCNGKNDDTILVYVNAHTLAEEQLLILLETDGGTLTK